MVVTTRRRRRALVAVTSHWFTLWLLPLRLRHHCQMEETVETLRRHRRSQGEALLRHPFLLSIYCLVEDITHALMQYGLFSSMFSLSVHVKDRQNVARWVSWHK